MELSDQHQAEVEDLAAEPSAIKTKKSSNFFRFVQLNKYQTHDDDEFLSIDFWFFTRFWLFLHVGNIKLFCTSKNQNKNNSLFLCRKSLQILVYFQKSTNNFMSNHGYFSKLYFCLLDIKLYLNVFFERMINGILLSKLFYLLREKKCYSDREKLLKFEAEGQEFLKNLRSLEQFNQTVKSKNNFC